MKRQKDTNIVNKILIAALLIFLIVYAVSVIATLGWGLLTSFKNDNDYSLAGNKLGFPNLEFSSKEFLQWENYRLIIEHFEWKANAKFFSNGIRITHRQDVTIVTLVVNTVIYAGMGALLHAFVPCVTAYLCVKYPYKLSKIIYSVCLIIQIIPIVGAYPSEISLLRSLGVYDTFLGYFMQKFNFTGMYFFVFHAYFRGVPDSYTEAAEVDGASQTAILFRIILPLAVKMISTVTLILFIQLWNDYQTPLLYLPTRPTLAYGVYHMVYGQGVPVLNKLPIKVAGCMVLALPILVAFIFLKDKLMGNVSIGGIKD